MKTDKSNPESNQLPTGINEAALINAIEASGYPLQGIVASKLDSHFSVTEEWGYIDRDKLIKQDWISIDTERILSQRVAQTTVGSLLIHPTPGWQDPD